MSWPRPGMIAAAVATAAVWAALAAPAVAVAGPAVVPSANPNDPGSAELVERPAEYDGASVDFIGEAVGDVMVRGENAWIHLNDDAYMYENVEQGAPLGGFNSGMPVWLAAELAEGIERVGDHSNEGDRVRVRGTFNAACAEHGGDMDIHATDLEVVAPGHRAPDPVHPLKPIWALALAVIAAAVWYGERTVSLRELSGAAKRR